MEAAGTLDKASRGLICSERFHHGHRNPLQSPFRMLPLTAFNSEEVFLMSTPAAPKHNLTAIKWLTFLMFMMFAMTTDSVGNYHP